VIFQDFPGPRIFKKKIQDFPGGVETLITSTFCWFYHPNFLKPLWVRSRILQSRIFIKCWRINFLSARCPSLSQTATSEHWSKSS